MNDDIDRLMAVMSAGFDPIWGEAWNRRQVEDALAFGHTHYFLISPEGTPALEGEPAAGFSLSRTGFEEEELLLLAVRPEYRRCGLGGIMLNSLRDAARSRGAKRLLLEMRKGNPAESLYKDFGFCVIGERPDYYRRADGQRIDAITFACDISR
ncbi:GNAT family N-acetyltransferase [Novosphingobium pentaromativorans]|uniref:Acetyltransferase n=1 Tax=Novosphingobium pentaromativorans US6-1 TaxID=1088721 RepID=G6E8G4_9SPHN|nr:GNAT family N-acetyltransferase [Novosphingobium pentaromativorans]AIT81348.1 acetyltransferase [Novosphingobium pentaromativorans US6-1]EHJ62504.1 acetyltransferase [Novosphingobium pentaromativorans US6-1]